MSCTKSTNSLSTKKNGLKISYNASFAIVPSLIRNLSLSLQIQRVYSPTRDSTIGEFLKMKEFNRKQEEHITCITDSTENLSQLGF